MNINHDNLENYINLLNEIYSEDFLNMMIKKDKNKKQKLYNINDGKKMKKNTR
jgi:hypothetical protein